MNRQFWLRHRPLPPPADSCAQVRPLLSLMSDGMASGKETAFAQAHLLTCADCRQALVWIEATRQAIVARPAVLPPDDMRARIARAIAASAETTVPAVPVALPAVRRAFAVRPAYAAAASIVVAGAFLAHSLLTGSHGPDSTVPAAHPSSWDRGKVALVVPALKDAPRALPAPVLHHQPLVASNPSANRLKQAMPAPGTAQHSLHAVVPPLFGLVASLPTQSSSPAPQTKPSIVSVAAGLHATVLHGTVAPHMGTVLHPRPLLATATPPKMPVGVRTHLSGQGPLLATLPPARPDTHAPLGPGAAVSTPPAVAVAAPETQVARLPEASPTPSRAALGDGLGSVRLSLASYHSEGYAHRLSMANGVHLRENYVQGPIAYTPTSLSETPSARRRSAVVLRPVAPPSATPAAELSMTNQRRSERDKQWSDTTTSGGA